MYNNKNIIQYFCLGYDCNDAFIDDSDAHDVHVPQEYDTWHGGFYVNQVRFMFTVM